LTDSSKQTRNGLLAVAAAVIFFGMALFAATALKGPSPESINNSQLELRDKLVWSCEYVGNPLREVVQSMIREEIHSSKRIKPSYFPDIPPAVFHHLLEVQLAAKERRLKRAAPINCDGLFPPP